MRVLLIGILMLALFAGAAVGTFLLLEQIVPHESPQPSGDPVTTPTVPPPPAEPTAQPRPAVSTPIPATPVPAIEPTATPDLPLSFQLTTNHQQYRVGDLLVLTASANQTCYLLLYDVDSQGKAARFFPNSFVGEPRLFPEGQRRIPGDDEEFELPMEGPSGSGYIHAICSRNPIEGLFEVYQSRDAFEVALRRQVAEHTAGQWAEMKIPYQITANR